MGPRLQSLIEVGMKGAQNFKVADRAFDGLRKKATAVGKAFAWAQGKLVGLGKTMLRTAKWVALIGAVTTIAFGRSSVMAFAQYEQALQNAVTVTGLAGDAFDRAKESLFGFGLAISRISSKTPTEVANAFYSLGSAGLTVNQQMAAAPGIIALAEATIAEMGQTTELVTSSMKAFGLKSSDTNRIVNVLAAAIGSSRMNIERLSAALPYAAATAHGFNISLETTTALLAKLVDNGLEASMAGTGLRAVLARLADVGDEAEKILSKYHVSVDELNVSTHGFLPVLEKLEKAQISQGDLFKIFGVRAANTATILTKTGTPAIKAFTKAISGTNRAFEMQAKQLDSVAGRWNILKSTLQELKIELVRNLGPSMKKTLESLQSALDKILKSEEWDELRAAVTLTLGTLGEKAGKIAEGKLPEWLKKVTEWLKKLTDMDMDDWANNFEEVMARAELAVQKAVSNLSAWLAAAGAAGLVATGGKSPQAWAATGIGVAGFAASETRQGALRADLAQRGAKKGLPEGATRQLQKAGRWHSGAGGWRTTPGFLTADFAPRYKGEKKPFEFFDPETMRPTAAGQKWMQGGVNVNVGSINVNDESRVGEIAGREIQKQYDRQRRATAAPG